MSTYDPNWLTKLRAKNFARQERELSHLQDPNSKHMLCGNGFFNGIRILDFPSLDALPGCRNCREIYLKSINVEIDPKTGYPLNTPLKCQRQ